MEKEVGLQHNTISDRIKEIKRIWKELSETADLPIPTKYKFLGEKFKILLVANEIKLLCVVVISLILSDTDNPKLSIAMTKLFRIAPSLPSPASVSCCRPWLLTDNASWSLCACGPG